MNRNKIVNAVEGMDFFIYLLNLMSRIREKMRICFIVIKFVNFLSCDDKI